VQLALTVAALEDKIVQCAVATILNQIYEEDFRGFSYGSRPGPASMTRWMRCRTRS
jgi:retron-type reverse transcriptase